MKKNSLLSVLIIATVVLLLFGCSSEPTDVEKVGEVPSTEAEATESTEETSISSDILELSEEEYKELCKEMYYDDVFFGDNLSKGDFVKLNLMVSENRYFTMDDFYKDSLSKIMDEWNIYRDFRRCSVLRENEDSYFGIGKIDLFFSNHFELDPNNYQPGDKIIIYGEVISFYKDEWDGYNDIIIVPKYIEIQ